ncbi:MAG: 50S ribosomal protein L24 [Patescibacteria group bacterium]
MTIKKDDNVIVIAGKDKGKTGKVTKSMPKTSQVLVSGINMAKKHQKPRQKGQKGQMIEMAMPIHVSNVRLESVKKEKKVKK